MATRFRCNCHSACGRQCGPVLARQPRLHGCGGSHTLLWASRVKAQSVVVNAVTCHRCDAWVGQPCDGRRYLTSAVLKQCKPSERL